MSRPRVSRTVARRPCSSSAARKASIAARLDPLKAALGQSIIIENDGGAAVQLVSREWTISDGRGGRHDVQGEGVVGEQPVIEPGGAFDYVSGCPLNTPTGWMEGRYRMVAADGRGFEAAIPRFPLVAPAVAT